MDGDDRRVLVVDDHVDTAEILGALLQSLGCETRAAMRGHDVLNAALDFDPDLILLDIGLPDLDGYRVVELLRADIRVRRCVIVAVSGWGRAEDFARAFDAGFDEYALKPITREKLRSLLRSTSPR